MAKALRVACDRCDERIHAGQSFCRGCGHPTQWASYEERTSWEVAQWRAANGVDASRPRVKTNAQQSLVGRWLSRSFARPAKKDPVDNPFFALVRTQSETRAKPVPKPEEPAAGPAQAVVVDVTDTTLAPPAPVRRPHAPSPPAARAVPPPRAVLPPRAAPPTRAAPPAPAVAVAPVPGPALEPEPTLQAAPTDDEPLRDTTMTVRAMRLLNMRVAELDAAVRKLQSDLDEHRSSGEKRA